MAREALYEFLGKIPVEWEEAIREITEIRRENRHTTGDDYVNMRSTINGMIYASLSQIYPQLEYSEKEEWILGDIKPKKKNWLTEMFKPVGYIANPRRRRRSRDEEDDDEEED